MKMERLMEDAVNIKRLLPWLESEEDVINFMRKIPLDKSHMRNQLTLCHFFKTRDCYLDGFEKQIEDDAREIVLVIPDISYKEIKERLTVLGDMSNRKEVVLRQLLHKKRDLDTILKEINVSVKKRKNESNNNVFALDSTNSHTNINIKIRKVDGSLEVVSSISNDEKPREKSSTSKNSSDSDDHSDEPTTSSTSVTSSTSNSSNSSPDSTVPSTTTEADDPCPELTAILNDLINTSGPSITEPVMPIRSSTVPSVSNSTVPAPPSVVENPKILEIPNTKSDNIKPEENVAASSTASHESSTSTDGNKKPNFNLIGFVKELSLAPEIKIFQLCKRLKLDLNERPSEDKLNYLLNQLFDNVVEVESADSADSDPETQEYDFDDDMIWDVPFSPDDGKQNDDVNVNVANEPPINTEGSATQKEFNLRKPILNLEAPKVEPTVPSRVVKLPTLLAGPSIIQPARFNLTEARNNVFPAFPTLPPRFLEAINRHPVEVDVHRTDVNVRPTFVNLAPKMAANTAINLSINKPVCEPMQLDEPEPGPSKAPPEKKGRVLDQNLVLRLIEMFPEACPEYIRNVCDGKQWADLDDVVTVILSASDYPKRPERAPSPPQEVDLEKQFEIIKELLPDADPTYLRMQCERFANNDKGLKEFVNQAMEIKDYPTMKEYLRKQQLSAQQKQYTTEFNIENFIQLFPDPEKAFSDPKRALKIETYSAHYVNLFFRNRYDKISTRVIQQVLQQCNFKPMLSDKALADMIRKNVVMKSRRKPSPLPENLQNIPLLQELAYITHETEVKDYLLQKKKREEQERIEAKENGLMETCQCCYDEEVMPKDTFQCPGGCKFCRDCIQRSCEVALGDGKTDFPCLAACSTEFTLQTLQSVLPPKMFSKLAQKKALAEIKAAGIEELETCPFCDFASIPNETDKIFRCLNPDCMKESCRLCKEPNHVPLKCEEVEKDQDVKARTYIENKMTEALIRKCWKCGTSFFKEEGCNKMTCSCGAHMCYICQQPVKDYTHFNGIGGDKHHLCPLYSDTNLVNQQNVLTAAKTAKAEVGPANLKVDPTVGIKDHFKKRAKKLPREPHMDVLQRINHHRDIHVHQRPHHRPRHHPNQAQMQRLEELFRLRQWGLQD